PETRRHDVLRHHKSAPGSVWFHDIVPTCLRASFRPLGEGAGDVSGEARGHGGQGRGQDQGGGLPYIRGLVQVDLRALPPLRRGESSLASTTLSNPEPGEEPDTDRAR